MQAIRIGTNILILFSDMKQVTVSETLAFLYSNFDIALNLYLHILKAFPEKGEYTLYDAT